MCRDGAEDAAEQGQQDNLGWSKRFHSAARVHSTGCTAACKTAFLDALRNGAPDYGLPSTHNLIPRAGLLACVLGPLMAARPSGVVKSMW